MTDDQLLQQYAVNRSESAFAALVERHVNTVYAAALRQVGDPQVAEEVMQSVFLILSQKRLSLRNGRPLVGWLYRVTYFAAKHALRSEFQRQRLQSKAVQMQAELYSEPDSTTAWQDMVPVLDAALNQLAASDRDAILLRFFQDRTAREVGVALGISEEAAKKRVGRAVAKMKVYFGRRGIVMPAGLIAAGLTHSSLQAAPAHLISSVIACAAGNVGASTSTVALVKGALTLMAQTRIKTATVAAVALLLATSTGVLIRNHAAPPAIAADEARLGGNGNPLPDWRAMLAAHPGEKEKILSVWCFDNLRQIDAAAYYWAETHGHRFPDELLALKDNDQWRISPRYLTCPSDTPRKEVRAWALARHENVSYTLVNPRAEFTRDPSAAQPWYKCPIHGHVIRTDATVDWGDTRFDKDETCRLVGSLSERRKQVAPSNTGKTNGNLK